MRARRIVARRCERDELLRELRRGVKSASAVSGRPARRAHRCGCQSVVFDHELWGRIVFGDRCRREVQCPLFLIICGVGF